MVAAGGWTLAPLSPVFLRRTWKDLCGRRPGQRLSAYALTARGRTVYLAGPYSSEGPLGLLLHGDRVMLHGVDARGSAVFLPAWAFERVGCYVVVADGSTD